jgi:ribosomal protein S12 methylthiotransferase accessory factor
MSIKVFFPGGKKVYAQVGNFTIETDQPIRGGGEGTAPSPFELFLGALGTCAGIYIKGFCDSRGLDSTGIEIIQDMEFSQTTGKMTKVVQRIKVPVDFPEKYYDALVRSADQCKVKDVIANPPEFDIQTVMDI